MNLWRIYFYTLVFLIALTHEAFGSEFWVTYPELVSREKQRHGVTLVSEDFKTHDLLSIYDALIAKPGEGEQIKALLALEEQAQEEALAGQFQTAFDTYGRLLTKLQKIPNVLGVEKITLAALIRKAELASLLGDVKSENYWREAHAWAPEAILPQDVYSPAVVEKFKSVGKTPGSRREVHVFAPPDSSVFIDGRAMVVKNEFSTLLVEVGVHQIEVLTPGSLWEVQNLNVTAAKTPFETKITPPAVVAGSCDNPSFLGKSLPNGIRLIALFNDGGCVRVFDGAKWYSIKGSVVGNILGNQDSKNQDSKKREIENLTLDQSAPREKSWLSSLTESPWFWVGAGAVVAGSAYMILQGHASEEAVLIPTQR